MTNLAFMFSNWYSGATLFAILLNSNRQLVCNGETFEFEAGDVEKESYCCSCGERLPDCQFFQAAGAQFWLHDRGDMDLFRVLPGAQENPLSARVVRSFSRMNGLRRAYVRLYPGLKKRLDHYLQLHDKFYENALSIEKARCYVDGTKSVRRAELFKLYKDKSFVVLHLIRDGRGFAWSYLRNNGLAKSQLDAAAEAWLSYINLVDTFADRYPSIPVHVVRYEDLCHQPAETLAGVCKVLGVEYDPAMVARPQDFHVLGNQIRHTFDGTVRESLSWQENFSDEEKRELEVLMEPQLKRFSYI